MTKEAAQIDTTYDQLTTAYVDKLDRYQAQRLALQLIAERGVIKDHGKILSWSDFNENPDPLINMLLARILVDKIDRKYLYNHAASQIAVISIENSAGYLASEVSRQVERVFNLYRPPRIIRVRKSTDGSLPSPAMGEIIAHTTVTPITSNNIPRHLVGSISKVDVPYFLNTRSLLAVDDFKATGDTLRGGIELGFELLNKAGIPTADLTVIPLAGLGKPQQYEMISVSTRGARILDSITALDVHFWPDRSQGKVFIEANGDGPLVMERARIENFALLE
ncbi:hypothetical protein A2154_00575 [Candidatus Gottesmanbacteria bacterium RBG_16_43_7]|uniref:Phosphoribosyltransferase domain-containing protein n=1 Tax=Candidatus Gottesmanbacteria bacterium RBG_16_43_7 TaxID=1798373 RepID=A0A1F5Z802_9BACT|nr:MAG: hypothetical protein A2154_00575 [Candidatus Gottesmanbacteria bacterium RBG_16_43_7]